MDEEKAIVSNLGEIYDAHNLPNMDKSVYDIVPISDDIKLTGAMKMVFVLFGIVGIFYSLYSMGIFQAAVWTLALIFILDMMGIFDKISGFFKESRQPRGGYDNIER